MRPYSITEGIAELFKGCGLNAEKARIRSVVMRIVNGNAQTQNADASISTDIIEVSGTRYPLTSAALYLLSCFVAWSPSIVSPRPSRFQGFEALQEAAKWELQTNFYALLGANCRREGYRRITLGLRKADAGEIVPLLNRLLQLDPVEVSVRRQFPFSVPFCTLSFRYHLPLLPPANHPSWFQEEQSNAVAARICPPAVYSAAEFSQMKADLKRLDEVHEREVKAREDYQAEQVPGLAPIQGIVCWQPLDDHVRFSIPDPGLCSRQEGVRGSRPHGG